MLVLLLWEWISMQLIVHPRSSPGWDRATQPQQLSTQRIPEGSSIAGLSSCHIWWGQMSHDLQWERRCRRHLMLKTGWYIRIWPWMLVRSFLLLNSIIVYEVAMAVTISNTNVMHAWTELRLLCHKIGDLKHCKTEKRDNQTNIGDDWEC